MNIPCGKSGRVWWLAALAVFLAGAVRADLAEEVSQFISDHDRLIAQHTLIAADRVAMGQNLTNDAELRKSVRSFFSNRAEAQTIRLLKALDRKDMRIALNFKGEKLSKPVKGTGDLTQDVNSYITNFDAWKLQQSLVEQDIAAMRLSLTNQDSAGLTTSTTSFFTNARLRHQKRLQWQSDIRAMKKDVSFKGSGKAQKPTGEKLADFVSAFLADRGAWEAKAAQLDADRNALRGALSNNAGLQDAVLKFLTTRREQLILSKELFLDREAMRSELRGERAKERRVGQELTAKDLDADEESGELEESTDVAGEK